MLRYPPDKVFLQEDPLPADLVRGEPLLYQPIHSLMANVQKLLGFPKGIEYPLNFF